jgi:hypothetical protein
VLNHPTARTQSSCHADSSHHTQHTHTQVSGDDVWVDTGLLTQLVVGAGARAGRGTRVPRRSVFTSEQLRLPEQHGLLGLEQYSSAQEAQDRELLSSVDGMLVGGGVSTTRTTRTTSSSGAHAMGDTTNGHHGGGGGVGGGSSSAESAAGHSGTAPQPQGGAGVVNSSGVADTSVPTARPALAAGNAATTQQLDLAGMVPEAAVEELEELIDSLRSTSPNATTLPSLVVETGRGSGAVRRAVLSSLERLSHAGAVEHVRVGQGGQPLVVRLVPIAAAA